MPLLYDALISKMDDDWRKDGKTMKQLEKVEKLRQKADITYEEAKAVLEECGWDLLDAVVKLEADGKIKDTDAAYFSTERGGTAEEAKSPQQLVESYQNYQQSKAQKGKGFLHSIWDGVKLLVRKGCENKFIVKRHGALLMDIPVLLLAILLLASFSLILVLIGISLFFGFRYSFAGPDLGRDDINNIMSKATDVAENLKSEVKSEAGKQENKGRVSGGRASNG